MALIIRIDVDRPYGSQPLWRHFLSRISSDFYLPKVPCFGYLRELEAMLDMLNQQCARAYVFFRRCTLPSSSVIRMMKEGGHQVGLHLENSISYESFSRERDLLERHLGSRVTAFSKHGSGGKKYGFHHHRFYEPDRYRAWANQSEMKLFLGNLEDPTLRPDQVRGVTSFPGAFWLEPYWRDTSRFTTEWLISQAAKSDLVLLVHPENVLASPSLVSEFNRIIKAVPSKILE